MKPHWREARQEFKDIEKAFDDFETELHELAIYDLANFVAPDPALIRFNRAIHYLRGVDSDPDPKDVSLTSTVDVILAQAYLAELDRRSPTVSKPCGILPSLVDLDVQIAEAAKRMYAADEKERMEHAKSYFRHYYDWWRSGRPPIDPMDEYYLRELNRPTGDYDQQARDAARRLFGTK
jgi:hypothetical protein